MQFDPAPDKAKRHFSLVQCGSSSLTSAQGNYATIELECLAIQYAVSKSEFYLRGLPTFHVWTDHRPLVGIFNKQLHMLNNQRFIRIREKLLDFSFTVTWVPDKTHYIADALSRYPVFEPHEMELPIDDITTCFRVHKLMLLNDITSAVDADYTRLIAFVKGNQCFDKIGDRHIAKLFHDVMNELSVCMVDGTDLVILKGTRIVVPFPAHKFVIRELHNAHSGLTKSVITAQMLYYWPGMHSDIKSYIHACVPCQQARPSLARSKLLSPVPPSQSLQPMHSVSLDLFTAAGQDWLAMVDRFSGYAWTAQLSNTTTRHMLSHLQTWFTDFS